MTPYELRTGAHTVVGGSACWMGRAPPRWAGSHNREQSHSCGRQCVLGGKGPVKAGWFPQQAGQYQLCGPF